jgi:hypothetical protein
MNEHVVGAFRPARNNLGWRRYLRSLYRYQRALGLTVADAKTATVTTRWDHDGVLPPRCQKQVDCERRAPFRLILCPRTAKAGSPFCPEHS